MNTTKKKIAILTSGHSPFDDRIFWKFGLSLSLKYEVYIISSLLEIETSRHGIHIIGFTNFLNKKEKIAGFRDYILKINPDIIICAQPLTIFAARDTLKLNKNCKIIYDVTEWYPENVAFKFKLTKRIFSYLILFISNIILSNLCNMIIVGELSKLKRYKVIAPFKNKIVIGYYPVLKYFNYSPPVLRNKIITLCYAGVITFERGIMQLYNAARLLSVKRPELKVELIIAGRFSYSDEEIKFNQLISNQNEINVIFKKWTDYDKISSLIQDADICFDLRNRNFIYRNSLPIKIFEYMACGKPFIYSDIKPIRKELNKIECGFFVNPDNLNEIVSKIEMYLDNNDLFLKHSKTGRTAIEQEMNWEKESIKLFHLVEKILK